MFYQTILCLIKHKQLFDKTVLFNVHVHVLLFIKIQLVATLSIYYI